MSAILRSFGYGDTWSRLLEWVRNEQMQMGKIRGLGGHSRQNVMDAAPNNPIRGRVAVKKTGSTSRRVWTTREEHVLLSALKDLVNKGWKTDNGFRTGYLHKLEDALKLVFPQTDLVRDPHITSKLTAWKKTYSTLVTAMNLTTGIGFNTTTSTLDVSDEQWESIVQKDPTMANLRFKEWPMYPEWVDIFGKDRATGEAAEDVREMANVARNKRKRMDDTQESNAENHINLDGQDGTPVNCSNFNEETEANSTAVNKEEEPPSMETGKKRKSRMDSDDIQMAALVKELCHTTGDRLEMVARRIGYDHDLGIARKQLFGILGKIEGLNIHDKLDVAEILGAKVELMEIFMGLTDEARALYAMRILDRAKA
ncbi:hypothetical protein ACS0TY_019038 [Phlomoides rotata]